MAILVVEGVAVASGVVDVSGADDGSLSVEVAAGCSSVGVALLGASSASSSLSGDFAGEKSGSSSTTVFSESVIDSTVGSSLVENSSLEETISHALASSPDWAGVLPTTSASLPVQAILEENGGK